jgi:hypothetical protein
MVLPDKVYLELDKRRKSDYSEIFNCYRTEYNYKNIVDYISVESLATSNGEVRAARNSGGNILTMEQRSILSAADLGSDISIKIRFKLKKTLHDSLFTSKIIDGEATVTD